MGKEQNMAPPRQARTLVEQFLSGFVRIHVGFLKGDIDIGIRMVPHDFLDAFSVLVCFFIIVASIGLGFKLPPVSAFSCNCFNSTYRVLSIQLIGSRGSKNCFYNFEKELRFLVVCYTSMPCVWSLCFSNPMKSARCLFVMVFSFF